jgi:ElaB/YqjD/DUF883 family membrane-anchored ribosome-binding protein
MPNQIVKTHIQNGHASQVAQTVVAEYQSIRDAEGDIEDAQIKALYARYGWGRALCNAVTDIEATQTDFCKEIAARLDKSVSYVQHHLRFARACVEQHADFEPPVAGYIAHSHDRGRKLTWSAAIRWMSSSTEQETDQDSEEVHHAMKEVERRMEALEEAAEGLSERYLDQADSLGASEREAVEGVLTRARQALEDERHRMETLPVEDEERVECEPYRRWVADHACCHCGVTDDTVVLHHPEHVYADDGGHATKISDFLGVPLCFDCHQKAEGPEERFWEQSPVDPREVAARLQSEWNAKLTQTE